VPRTLQEVLDRGDVTSLRALLAQQPQLAATRLERSSVHPRGASPLGYVAMLRYDASGGIWRDVPDTDALARALLEAGAPVEGEPGERETPLITAASYGDAAVARVLVEAGADITVRAAPDAGGVPGGTPLLHAAVFGMTAVVDVLAAAGAAPQRIEEAAAVGDVSGFAAAQSPLQARVRALVMAADHERLNVIDDLLAAATPIDVEDEKWGRQALRVAARNGRVRSVEHLLARGADPDIRDGVHDRTALGWCRAARGQVADRSGHDRVEALLEPVTATG
jgi:ankyrin repeat protein